METVIRYSSHLLRSFLICISAPLVIALCLVIVDERLNENETKTNKKKNEKKMKMKRASQREYKQ